MIDEVKLYHSFSTSKEKEKFLNRTEFGFLVNRAGNFNGRLRNLFVTVYPFQNVLRVSNSIHKFYKNENYSTFTRREIEFALIEFEEFLKIPLKDFTVNSIAIGLNINVNQSPEAYLPIPISYRGKRFYEIPPKEGKRVIEVICGGGEMSVKFYNKSEQFYRTEKKRLESPFHFRFETVFRKMRPILKRLNKTSIQANELCSEAFIMAMAMNQLAVFETIDKKMADDLSNYTSRDYCLLQSFPNVPEEIRKNHKESYKKDRCRYLRLKKELSTSDLKVNELRDKFKEEVGIILCD